jgi:hypothetical protein
MIFTIEICNVFGGRITSMSKVRSGCLTWSLIISLLLLWLPGLGSEPVPVYYDVAYDGLCPYSALIVNDEFLFDFPNLSISPIDTLQLHSRLLEDLTGGVLDSADSSASTKEVLFRLESKPELRLIASYKFADEPDFLLLRYFWRYVVMPQIVHVAYFKSTGNWYVLSSGVPDPVKVLSNYNKMIDENPGALGGVSCECRAAMIISISYADDKPVFVIDTYEDIVVSNAFEQKIGRGFDYPLNQEHLYYFNPSTDDVLMYFLRGIEITLARRDLSLELSSSSIDSAGIIMPLIADSSLDSTSVEMTVYQWWVDEISRWRTVFAADGHLISIDCVQPPIYRFGIDSDNQSPYTWITRARSTGK